MRKNNRIPLSPCLKRFKFFFDLLKKTTEDYLFFADLQENIVMVSPNLVQDFELPILAKTLGVRVDELLGLNDE